MTVRLATTNGIPEFTLSDVLSDMLYESNHKCLHLGLLLSCVEASMALRTSISDEAVLDLIAAALERAKKAEAGWRAKQ